MDLAAADLQPVTSGTSQFPDLHHPFFPAKVKSQAALRTRQQGIPSYSTDLLTGKLLFRRLPSLCLGLAQEWVPGSQLYSLNQKGSGIGTQAVPSQDPVMPVIHRYRTKTVLTPARLCAISRMKTESRWIQTNKAHRQDNTAQHSRPFPSRILAGSQQEGCYNYCYHGMEKWVCDSSNERLLTIALVFCWLLGSSPSLVQGSHLPALPQANYTNTPFSLLPSYPPVIPLKT